MPVTCKSYAPLPSAHPVPKSWSSVHEPGATAASIPCVGASCTRPNIPPIPELVRPTDPCVRKNVPRKWPKWKDQDKSCSCCHGGMNGCCVVACCDAPRVRHTVYVWRFVTSLQNANNDERLFQSIKIAFIFDQSSISLPIYRSLPYHSFHH